MSSQSASRYVPISTKMENPALSGSSGDVDADSTSVEAAGIPATCSSQQLMPPPSETRTARLSRHFSDITASQWFTVTVLCFVNMINYMDRFTIAGVLTDIQDDFKIGDDHGGLLQTAFVVSYMICAPIFGYLGDRYTRRWIMAFGVLLWSTTTFLGSFMNSFGLFITFRGMVGVGEASYSTIAPTIISDLFVGSMRTKMLALFYFAIPVGSGMGYIIGSETARALGDWRWALRVTPFLGIAAVVLILCTKDPERGESEGAHNLETTTYGEDLRYLLKHRTFMLLTGGLTCVAFVTGALAWWGPKFIYLGMRLHPGKENLALNDVALIFGIITMTAGILGVPLGPFIAHRLVKYCRNADPLVCACGLILSAIFLGTAMFLISEYTKITFILVFFGQLSINMNWAVMADMLLYVVIPTRRSTAEACQILISHAFGDAGSPYLVGVISESLKASMRLSFPVVKKSYDDGLETLSLTLDGNLLNGTNVQNATSAVLDATSSMLNATSNIFNTTSGMLGTASDMLTATPRLVNASLGGLNASEMMRSTFTDYEDLDTDSVENMFKALQYALFTTIFVEVLGGIFFLLAALFIVRDKQRALSQTQGLAELPAPPQSGRGA